MIRVKNVTPGALSIYTKGGGCLILRKGHEATVDETLGPVKVLIAGGKLRVLRTVVDLPEEKEAVPAPKIEEIQSDIGISITSGKRKRGKK